MSTCQTNNQTKYPTVLVRAAASEPVKMLAVGKGPSGTVAVGRKQGGESLNMPVKYVRKFNEGLGKQLLQAFLRGDRDALNRLWAKAEPFDLAILRPRRSA